MNEKELRKQEEDTPANYDRWDTFTGTVTVTSKNTPEQQDAIDNINAQYAVKHAADYDIDEAEARINYRMGIDIVWARKALGYELTTSEYDLLNEAVEKGIPAEFYFCRHLAKELRPDIDYCMEYKDAFIFSNKDDISIGGKSPVVILKKNGEVIPMIEYTNSSHGELVREMELEDESL